MPLEIRELVIRATVNEAGAGGQTNPNSANSADSKEADVNLIVEKVLEILKEQSER